MTSGFQLELTPEQAKQLGLQQAKVSRESLIRFELKIGRLEELASRLECTQEDSH